MSGRHYWLAVVPSLMLAISVSGAAPRPVASAAAKPDTSHGDRMLADYFQAETARLQERCLAEIKTLDQWKSRREVLRRQLLEMLGLDPLPERTDLKATITGRIQRDGIVVEKLHFQSRPHLYVTGNLYLPEKIDKPCPAVLYVCGHGGVKIQGVSFGNKVTYQHHGAWLARHGYVCLTIDTLQLGEIEGIHHGTYSQQMWWWLNRGYTPAGVEAWNCVRALDYLQSRKEVDGERIGVTGRSGGGAYSWWIASIDERIKAAVPVAGITDLMNHVVDGCVEGHCDCMYMVNTYQWDYPAVAALIAPRSLILANSDRDRIFPLDGVVRTYNQARRIYEMYRAGDALGLSIVPGPHKDTQDLQVPAFRWFNTHLKKEPQALVDEAAQKRFQPQELKVFGQLPGDALNPTIQETFVAAAATPPAPDSVDQWRTLCKGWRQALAEKSFRAWPDKTAPLETTKAYQVEHGGRRLSAYDFTSQGPMRLRLYVVDRLGKTRPPRVVLHVVSHDQWRRWMGVFGPAAREELKEEVPADPQVLAEVDKLLADESCILAFFAPRGAGRSLWDQTPRKQTQIRRRFMLLGQTLDGMQVWDVRRAIQAVQGLDFSCCLAGQGVMGGIALYAALHEPMVEELRLADFPATHRNGPIFLNVSRYLDMPQALALAAERCRVRLSTVSPSDWAFPLSVAKNLGWKADQLQVVPAR
jgi:dienelactone hydrolase